MQQRPVHLDLFKIRFPITAIASILHRVAGVILFLMIPFVLYVLQKSLTLTNSDFQVFMAPYWMKFLTWVFGSALIYNFFAGLRHFIMDFGVWETKLGGKVSSWLTLIISAILIILLGGHLCL